MKKLSQQPQTLVFDFDGTIADTLLLYFDLLNTLADKFNFAKLDTKNIDYYRTLNSHQIISMLNIPRLRLPLFVYDARKVLKHEIDRIHPVDGIRDTIAAFKNESIQLGIITSNSVKNVEAFLKKYDFPQFDFIFSSLRIWQKSLILKKVMTHNKLDHSKVFYIGDETRDIEAAHEAGIKAISVTWGFNSETILKSFSPDFLVTNPGQLATVLKQTSM